MSTFLVLQLNCVEAIEPSSIFDSYDEGGYRMKGKLVLSLVALSVYIILASDYGFGQKIYPVAGPLAAQTPQPVFAGQIRRPMFSIGPVFLLLKSWTVAKWRGTSGEAKDGKGDFREYAIDGHELSSAAEPRVCLGCCFTEKGFSLSIFWAIKLGRVCLRAAKEQFFK